MARAPTLANTPCIHPNNAFGSYKVTHTRQYSHETRRELIKQHYIEALGFRLQNTRLCCINEYAIFICNGDKM